VTVTTQPNDIDDELEMVRTNTVRGYARVPIHS
jgi:hypothetical protein